MKKLIAFLLSCMMLVNALPVNAEVPLSDLPVEYAAIGPDADVLGRYVDVDSFDAYIMDHLANYVEEIDLTEFDIPYTMETVTAIQQYIVLEMPEAFHVENYLTFYYSDTNITKIVPRYVYTKDDYLLIADHCEKAASEILSGITGNSALSDAEKVLMVHDRLALYCGYDTSAVFPNSSYNMDGALYFRTAVCEGYAEAFMFLLEKLGIECYVCPSDDLNHAWNIVVIDGKKYHVDVTWDDPVNDIPGQVFHNNVLRSTEGMFSTGHDAYDYDNSPSDDKYDNSFWQVSNTAFQLIDGELYYIDSENEALMRASDGKILADVSDKWMISGNRYYSSLARLASNGTNLFYSLSDEIYLYDVSEGESRLFFTPDLSIYGENYSIYGMAYKDGKLLLELNCDYNTSEYAVRGYVDLSEFCTHDDTTDYPDAPSTCETRGHDAYTKCNTCGIVISGSDALLPLGPHGETELRGAVDATETENGYTGDTCCTVCDAILVPGKVIIAENYHSPITSDVFEITAGRIYIPVGTSALDAIRAINENVSILVNGETVSEDTPIATGMIVTVTDGNGETFSLKIVVRGDVNCDGRADFKDVSSMLKHSAGWYNGIENPSVDMDGGELTRDVDFNFRDTMYLIRALAGWDGYFL